MNQNTVRSGLSAVLLALAIALLVVGCTSGGDDTTTTTTQLAGSETTTTTAALTGDTTSVALDELSTFQSKDPFKQQAVPPTTATTSGGGSGSTTSTTSGSGTTSTTKPSGVKDPLHSMKVLSIDVVNGVPVVTFEVDDVIYEDKKEGDVVSTSWGQIEVVSIDPDSQTVVFLHGSETRVLQVGQEFLK